MENKNWWRGSDERIGLSTIFQNIDSELIIFDTETTGLSPEKDRIIQISAIKCQIDEDMEFHEVSRLNLYINPERKLEERIIQITGLTDEFLVANGEIEDTAFDKVHNFFGDCAYVCGHNVTFDINMINALYLRNVGHNLEMTALDTLAMARELHQKKEAGSHKLGELIKYFGLDDGLTFHNSMDDVVATMRLLRLFISEYKEKEEIETPRMIDAKVKSCWTWSGKSFGRGDLQRLYVKLSYEDRVIYMNQFRPYEWGEKDKGTLPLLDMKNIEEQVMRLYKVNSLDELAKMRESVSLFRK